MTWKADNCGWNWCTSTDRLLREFWDSLWGTKRGLKSLDRDAWRELQRPGTCNFNFNVHKKKNKKHAGKYALFQNLIKSKGWMLHLNIISQSLRYHFWNIIYVILICNVNFSKQCFFYRKLFLLQVPHWREFI